MNRKYEPFAITLGVLFAFLALGFVYGEELSVFSRLAFLFILLSGFGWGLFVGIGSREETK